MSTRKTSRVAHTGSPAALIRWSSLISSRLWSKKSLLFLMTFRHTASRPRSRRKSRHSNAVLKAAFPMYPHT